MKIRDVIKFTYPIISDSIIDAVNNDLLSTTDRLKMERDVNDVIMQFAYQNYKAMSPMLALLWHEVKSSEFKYDEKSRCSTGFYLNTHKNQQ